MRKARSRACLRLQEPWARSSPACPEPHPAGDPEGQRRGLAGRQRRSLWAAPIRETARSASDLVASEGKGTWREAKATLNDIKKAREERGEAGPRTPVRRLSVGVCASLASPRRCRQKADGVGSPPQSAESILQ
ncbi:MAG: hypothetical protein KME26_11680 [Oscillatoria princeps RMCB-10]|nr:hypothetical protein [Oscillatoria princeps RMCB-10]